MTIDRRTFLTAASSFVLSPAFAEEVPPALAAYERETGGRIGLYAENLSSGVKIVWRAEERFVMCSTFKASLAAFVLSRVDRGQDSRCAVSSGYSGRDAFPGFDGDGKRRPQKRCIIRDLHGEVQFVAAFFRQRHTDQPTRVGRHEVYDFRRNFFSRTDEVALVFAVFVVNDNNHAPVANIGGGVFNRGKRHQDLLDQEIRENGQRLCYPKASFFATFNLVDRRRRESAALET